MRTRVKVKAKPPARTDSTPTKSVFETRPFGTQTSSTPTYSNRDGLSNLKLYLQRRERHLAWHAEMVNRSPLPGMMMKAQGEEGAANQTVKEAGTSVKNKSAIGQTMLTAGEGEMAREATGVVTAQNGSLSTNTGQDGGVHQLKRPESTAASAQSSSSGRDGLSNIELYLQRREAHLAFHAKMANRSPLPTLQPYCSGAAQGESDVNTQAAEEAGTSVKNKSVFRRSTFTTLEGEMAREATGVVSAQNDTLSTNTGRERDGEAHQLKHAESTVAPAQSSSSGRDGLSNLELYLQRREAHLAFHAKMVNRSPLPILQPYYSGAAQGESDVNTHAVKEAGTHQENNTGLPDHLKTGIESLSGMAMDDVKVHYNSPKPAQLQALAYAQGTNIHVAPGQESHLPHEAWHVVQQKQGRVRPTMQMKGVGINDDQGLEREADVMGAKASQILKDQLQGASRPVTSRSMIQLQMAFGNQATRSCVLGQRLPATSRPLQMRRSKQDKKLVQAGNERLAPLVQQFVNCMMQDKEITSKNRLDFVNGDKNYRKQFMDKKFKKFQINKGDLVEKPGLVHMQNRADKTLTSVKLRFRQENGTSFQERGELDGLLLDSNNRVVKIVSAKFEPRRVEPGHDRELLRPFYETRVKRDNESYQSYAYYLANKFSDDDHKTPTILAKKKIVGMNVELQVDGGNVQTLNVTDFRANYPLKAGSVDSTPVIGLTPKPEAGAERQTARNRGDINLVRTGTELYDDFAQLVANRLRALAPDGEGAL